MPLKPDDISFTLGVVAGPQGELLDIKVSDVWILNRNPNALGMRVIEKELLNTLKIFDKDTIEFASAFTDSDDEDEPIKKVYQFNTNHVTIKQFIDAIVDFEKIARPKSLHLWEGNYFYNHVFYEGIYLNEEGAYCISWGS